MSNFLKYKGYLGTVEYSEEDNLLHGKAAGIHYMGSINRQVEWAKKTGMNLLFHSGDMYLFLETLRNDFSLFRRELGLINLKDTAIKTDI